MPTVGRCAVPPSISRCRQASDDAAARLRAPSVCAAGRAVVLMAAPLAFRRVYPATAFA